MRRRPGDRRAVLRTNAGPPCRCRGRPRRRPDGDRAEAGDRRIVTALFADLVDYVRLVAEHDPEDVRDRVDAALAAMADAIEGFDGTREKFIGDAVFAVFGWPRGPRRRRLPRRPRRPRDPRGARGRGSDGGEPLEVRIGIATGEVVATRPRGDGDGDWSLTGAAITTAARIQALARPGEILLDEADARGGARTARASRTAARWSSAASREPIAHARGCEGEAGFGGRGDLRAPVTGPLVGREAERARLRALLDAARRPAAAARSLVVGEAGIGKTRLLAELETDARERGLAWTWAENTSYGAGRAVPVRPAVRPGGRRRARRGFRDVRAPDAVHRRTSTPRRAPLRRRDRRDRPRRRLLGLGGGGAGHARRSGRR